MAKGRSSSRALRPLLQQAAAVQLGARLYLAWLFVVSRFNVSDDPARHKAVRPAVRSPPGWACDPA
eukprot:8622080-Lingulodinium_polyedra.AAC.1